MPTSKPKRRRRTIAEQRLTEDERDLIERLWLPRMGEVYGLVRRRLPTAAQEDVEYHALLLLIRWSKYPYVDLEDERTITMLASSAAREVAEQWHTTDRTVRLPRVESGVSPKTRELVAEWLQAERRPLDFAEYATPSHLEELEQGEFVATVLKQLTAECRALVELLMQGKPCWEAALMLKLSQDQVRELLGEAAGVYRRCHGDD